jgi:hypothetical protein
MTHTNALEANNLSQDEQSFIDLFLNIYRATEQELRGELMAKIESMCQK